jgi:hypothetical protein
MANFINPVQFNIVLNSQQVSTQSSGNPNDCTYDFNWSNIPRGKYKMTFTYRGKGNADAVANDSPQIFLSLASTPSVYQASGQNGSIVSMFIGTLRLQRQITASLYYDASNNDNPDVFFNEVDGGSIRVQVFKDDFVTPFTTTAGSNLAEYVMVLSFSQIGKVYPYNL